MKFQLPKNVKALGVVSFFNDASTDMMYPLIPVFLTTVLGASLPVVGLIEGVAESTASLMKVISGWISDKLKARKGLTVLGYGLSMISKPVMAFATSPWHVLVVRFSDRFGKGIRQAPRDALIAESTPSEHLGHAYGFHKMMDTLGATAGPLLAMVLLPIFNDNLRTLFLFSFVASFFAVITLVIFVKEKKDEHFRRTFPKLSLKLLPRHYKFFLLALAIFTLGNSSDSFLFLRAQNVGVSVVLLPLLYALSNIVFALLATPFGKLADKVGPHKIMMWGFVVFAVSYAGFGLSSSQIAMWFLFPAYGVFSAMTDSIQKTITVRISDPQLKGTMLGLTYTTIGIFTLPSSIIAGVLWEKVGIATPFLFGSAMSIIAAVILLFTFFPKIRNQLA